MENNINPTPQENMSDTSEKQYPLMGGFFMRWLAFLIDSIIVGVITASFAVSLGFATAIASNNSDSPIFGLIAFVVSLGISILYFGWFYTEKGQTPGKMVMKLKVVRPDTLNYIGWGSAIIRETIGRIISGLVFWLGYLWYFMSPKRQAWHDTISETIVVQTDDDGNILMGGPSYYPKEPAKTFGILAGLIVLNILTIVAVFQLVSFMVGEIRSNLDNLPRQFDESDSFEYYLDEDEEFDFDNFFEQFEEFETDEPTQMDQTIEGRQPIRL